jgi:dCMP deaminase
MEKEWFIRFMELAKHISTWSKDPKAKVGCVIVDPENKNIKTIGHNCLVRDFEKEKYAEKYYEKPLKNTFMEHAERNAIYKAAECGISIKKCFIFCTHFPCPECSRGILKSGICSAVVLESSCNSYFRKSNAFEIEQSKIILNNNSFKIIILSEETKEEQNFNPLSFDPNPMEPIQLVQEPFITKIFI